MIKPLKIDYIIFGMILFLLFREKMCKYLGYFTYTTRIFNHIQVNNCTQQTKS